MKRRPLKRKKDARMRRYARLNKVNEKRKAKRRKKYDDYLKSPEWKAKRRECIERAGHQCERIDWKQYRLYAGSRLVVERKERCPNTSRLTAHHLTYARFGRELPEDLQCLCAHCHKHVEAMKGKRHFIKKAG